MTDGGAGTAAIPPPPVEVIARLREALNGLADAACTVTGAELCVVLALRDRRDLVVEAVAGKGAAVVPDASVPGFSGVAGWALAASEPIVVRCQDDPRAFGELHTIIGRAPTTLSAVPVVRNQESLGVLEILDGQAGHAIKDFPLLATFAEQAGVLLEELAAVQHSLETSAAVDVDVDELDLEALRRRVAAGDPRSRAAALRMLGALREMLPPS